MLLASFRPSGAFLALLFAAAAQAQCVPVWSAGYGCPGVSQQVTALVPWDPDGTGPAPSVVAVGGWFDVAGSVNARWLATWNPASGAFAWVPGPAWSDWTAVQALATLPGGELAVAYYDAGVPAVRVSSWNGVAWTQLGSDFDYDLLVSPLVLHVRPNGELFAGGPFTTQGGALVRGLARWTGAAWQQVGGGLNGSVTGLADDANGDLLVCGSFTTAGGVAANGSARWNGVAWTALGGSLAPNAPSAIVVSSGRTFAATGGGFYELVAGTWTLRPGLVGTASAQARLQTAVRLADGSILVGGLLATAGGVATEQVARFDPATNTWAALGAGLRRPPSISAGTPRPSVVQLASGDLHVGGDFTSAGGVPVANIARWNGSQWSALANGPAQAPACAVAIDDTRFAVGGTFTGLGNVVAANVAEWNGSAWVPIGTGLGGAVEDLVRLPNGDLVATGSFTTTGSGAIARGIARWNGSTWSELGGGLQAFQGSGTGRDLLVRANGDLVVVGRFSSAGGVPCLNIATWNGTVWTGLPGIVFETTHVAEAANGDLIVATGGSRVDRWNGASWSIVAGLQSDVITDLAPLPDGGFVVAGNRLQGGGQNGVLLYSSTSAFLQLQTAPNSSLGGLVALPGGDVLVTGSFFQLFNPAGQIVAAAANGSSVRITANGTFLPAPIIGPVNDADPFPNGDRLVVTAGWPRERFLDFVGRLTTTCPAAASVGGVGCAGSGGANLLAARALPWLGAVCESVATGMPAQGLAIGIRGLGTAAVPLNAVLPQALPGCTLLVTPDLLDAYVPSAGTVVAAFPIPNVAALVGAVLHQQVVAIETGGGGAITALTATNRLSLSIGAF